MRAISKTQEPASLTSHRAQDHSDYSNYNDKTGLRRALVREQRSPCCYCMGPIKNAWGSMKIEHWKSQRRFPAEQLNYRNLLGGCMGGENQPIECQFCDTRKGDSDLKWNPAEPQHAVEARIKYSADGTVYSNDAEFDRQLHAVLNLNLISLKNSRKGVFGSVLEWWRKKQPVPRNRIEREIERQVGGAGELQPFCQVAVWLLREKLTRMV